MHVGGAYRAAALLDFDPGPGVVSPDTDPPGRDKIVLATYDTVGTFQQIVLVASLTDQGHSENAVTALGADGAGNVYLAGQFIGTFDFDPGSGIRALTADGQQDAFVASFSPGGDLRYSFLISGNPGTDTAWGIDVEPDGRTHVTGSFTGEVDFDPGFGAFTLTSGISGFAEDAYVASYTSGGDLVVTSNEPDGSVPEQAGLLTAYPNPVRDHARLVIQLDRPGRLDVEVVDVLGRVVDRLSYGAVPAGPHRFRWTPGPLPNGLYLLRLVGAESVEPFPVLIAR